jgi:hypothetical protein
MAAYEAPLNFDAAIGTAALNALRPQTSSLHQAVLARVDEDGGHPLRALFEADYVLPAGKSTAWTPPTEKRVSPNRVLVEATHCAAHGLRPEALAYVCGPMRDEGGYHTAHGLWALVIAADRGCIPVGSGCWSALQGELTAAQPAALAPDSPTLVVDLFAERALMLGLSGQAPEASWLEALRAAQRPDGAWGVAAEGDNPYWRFHATMTAAWALAL